MALRFSVVDALWFNHRSQLKRVHEQAQESAAWRLTLLDVRRRAERRTRLGAMLLGSMVPVALLPLALLLLA